MGEALGAVADRAPAAAVAGILIYGVTLGYWLRRPEYVADLAERLRSLAEEQGFPTHRTIAQLNIGWVHQQDGRLETGLNIVREATEDLRARGPRLRFPFGLSYLAEACLSGGQAEEGLATIEEALAFSERTQDFLYVPELHRLRGELLIRDSDDQVAQAIDCFREAGRVARHQEARFLELRAAASLARVSREADSREESAQHLQSIYNWFTEGFETPDLREADALLSELH